MARRVDSERACGLLPVDNFKGKRYTGCVFPVGHRGMHACIVEINPLNFMVSQYMRHIGEGVIADEVEFIQPSDAISKYPDVLANAGYGKSHTVKQRPTTERGKGIAATSIGLDRANRYVAVDEVTDWDLLPDA